MSQITMPEHTSLIPLTDRGFLAITGPDARTFLQGMVTCNMDKLSDAQALYGAHLTSQGRLIEPFFVYLYEGKVILDCAKERLMPLAKSLHSYQMRFDIEFEDLTDDLAIFADLNAHGMPLGTCAPSGKNSIAIADPRLSEMGTRFLMPQQHLNDNSVEVYHTHRIKLGVPESNDYIHEKTIAGEFCLEFLNGVDYKKGCYIGQEMTARTHFRSPPKKRVVTMQYKGGKAPEHGAEVKAGNLKIGNVFSCANGTGIAIVRIAKAFGEDADLSADGIALTAQKPSWANYDIESK